MINLANEKSKKEKEISLKRLSEWQDKFETAWNAYDVDQFDILELLYLGTKQTSKNINNTSSDPIKLTNNVARVAFEYVESQISTSINKPIIRSKRDGFTFAAKMIQDKIINDMDELGYDRYLDLNERNTIIHGISGILMNWDYRKVGIDYIGEKEIVNLHAKKIIPQPSVYHLQEMDYFFIVTSVTKKYVQEKYGVSVDSEEEEYPEVNYLQDYITNRNKDYQFNTDPLDDKVNEIVCFYKDDDGDICKFTYVGDTVVEDLPKYYYPRIMICKKCQTENAYNAKECQKCKSKSLRNEAKMTETIMEDMELRPLVLTESRFEVVTDEQTGEKRVEQVDEKEIIERKIPKGTEVSMFAPKMYPVAIRLNIPTNFEFKGQSDVEIIQDQQESIKKIISKIEEEILGSGSVIGVPENIRYKPSNETYRVVRGKPQDINQINVSTLESNIQQKVQYFELMKSIVADTLGIPPAFQGKYDPSAKSGIAKEIQVQQAAGRLDSKFNNKRIFFEELYRIMFYFDLAFTNEPRPYIKRSLDSGYENNYFNKYEFLMQDKQGDWVYNTDFVIKADNNNTLPQDNIFLYNQAVQLLQMQAIDLMQFWEILDEVNFPMANKFLESLKKQQEEQEAMQMQQEEAMEGVEQGFNAENVLANLSPEDRAIFDALPPEQQNVLLGQLG